MNYPIFEPKEGQNNIRLLARGDGKYTLIDRADHTIKSWTPVGTIVPIMAQFEDHFSKFWGEFEGYDFSIFLNRRYQTPEWMLAPIIKKPLSHEDKILIAFSGDPALNHLKKDRYKKTNRSLLDCAFCLKTHKDVKVLVANEDDIGICEKCIRVSYNLAAKKLKQPTIDELESKLEKTLAPREKSYFEKLANR